MRTVLTQVSTRFGFNVYFYPELLSADRHVVSTTSSPCGNVYVRGEPPTSSATSRVFWDRQVGKPLHAHILVPGSNINTLDPQDEDDPSVFVSGAEAIVPKCLILYSEPSIILPTGSQSHDRAPMHGPRRVMRSS